MVPPAPPRFVDDEGLIELVPDLLRGDARHGVDAARRIGHDEGDRPRRIIGGVRGKW
jgi:hypothetical protein